MADADDRDFDRLLKEHADVRAAYRAASVDEQPAETLDAAILAASRRAVNAGPASVDRSRRFVSRIAVPLSAAAVMVLATSLSFLVYEERGTPSAPESSRAVHAPASDAATAGDVSNAAGAPAAPAAAPVEAPRSEAKSQDQAKTEARVAPLARNTESVRTAPVAAAPASPPRAPEPSGVATSEADSAAPSAPMPVARQEREAVAARYAENASERSAARNEVQESLAQAESARAASSGPATDRAAQARHADRPAPQLDAREDVAAEPSPPTSMPAEAPAAVSAKRLASRARELAVDSTARDEARPKAAPSPDEAPAAWIGRVRTLMDAGRIDAARAEAARLRCRYPDVTLPADLPAPKPGMECPAPAAKEGSSHLR